MNPGYLSLLAISISLILLASGWKDILLRGISHRAVLLFFVGWIVCSFVKMDWNGMAIYGVIVFVPLYAWAVLWRAPAGFAQFQLLASSVLLGVFHFVLLELNGFVPWLDFSNPMLEMALITAVLVMLISRQPRLQFLVVSFGLVLGEALFVGTHLTEGQMPRLGGPVFQDRWWLTFVFARTMTILLEYAWKGSVGLIRSWSKRSREWRSKR